MKTKLITFLLICFFTNIIFAQKVIKSIDFKADNLATILKTKGYSIVEQEATFVKIADKDATLFIDIDPNNKFLHFNVKILLKKTATKSQVDQLLNQINSLDMISARYMGDDNSIYFQYYFWTVNGFTAETLEDAVMEFFLYQGDAYGLDKDKIFDYL